MNFRIVSLTKALPLSGRQRANSSRSAGEPVKSILLIIASLLLSACLGMPEKVTPVNDFDLPRYLGKWHEIARLDHAFERGMTRVTAEYSLREDGGVSVINRGFLAEKEQWKEAQGKAYFVDEPTTGYLKVSFFGPFYGSYVIFDLDRENYRYAFVSGPNLSYLWLLAREPKLEPAIIERFVGEAKRLGFDTEQLIFAGQ